MNRLFRNSAGLCACALLAACGGTGKQDELREPVAQTGISVGLQVNLARGASHADAAASIYKDAKRQPLVGGDFFMARSSVDDAVLKSIENLSGNYLGRVSVGGVGDSVTLSTEYDPIKAREDRWYPVDELLVDPGPNPELVGYSGEVLFPTPLEITSARNATYTSRNDNIVLTWTPGDGEQMRANAIVTCVDNQNRTYTFPRLNILGNVDAAGTYTLQVRDVIPNTNIINAIASFEHELETLITAAVLNYYTAGLVGAVNIPLATFVTQHCDVDLTVFREKSYPRPQNVAGGFVIGSTSDTVRFRFQP